MGKRKTNGAYHRIDSGGRFVTIPHAVYDAMHATKISVKAKFLLVALSRRFNGFNNGRITMSFREMSSALGGCHFNAAKKALDELIDGGLVTPTIKHPKYTRLASEYRLSFISYGPENAVQPASNDYQTLLPELARQKQNSADNASTDKAKRAEPLSAAWKQPADDASTGPLETPTVSVEAAAEPSSTHIEYHGIGVNESDFELEILKGNTPQPKHDPYMQVNELRDFCRHYIEYEQYGGQSRLVEATGIPKGTLCKFINGRGLPDKYRVNLHIAVHNAFPVNERPVNDCEAA